MAGESRDDMAGAAAGGDSAPVAGGVATSDELPASLQTRLWRAHPAKLGSDRRRTLTGCRAAPYSPVVSAPTNVTADDRTEPAISWSSPRISRQRSIARRRATSWS